MPRFSALILCLATAVAGAAATGPTTAPSLAQQKDQDRRWLENQWQAMPFLPPQGIEQVLRFAVVNDRLAIDSPLYNGKALKDRVALSDLPGEAMVHIIPSQVRGSYYLFFELFDFSPPDLVNRHFFIISTPDIVEVKEDFALVDRTQSVTLHESLTPGTALPITLRIQIFPEKSDQVSSVNLALSAASLSDLRRQNAEEVQRYLRPMLRDLQQEPSAMAVEDKMGWQVLADTWSPPTGLAARVQDLVGRLGAEDYATRAKAQQQLEQMGQPAALYLMTIKRSGLSAEQSARVEKFLDPYRPLGEAPIAFFRRDVNFLLDCLYSDDVELRQSALEHLRRIGHDVPWNNDQSRTQRIAAIARLRRQLSAGATRGSGD